MPPMWFETDCANSLFSFEKTVLAQRLLEILNAVTAILPIKGETKDVQARSRYGDLAFDTSLPILANNEFRGGRDSKYRRSMRQLLEA
jgi:hypothetical protein